MLAKLFRCSDCDGSLGYLSRPKNFLEKRVLPLFLLRPVRCGGCYRRTYRSVFIDVKARPEPGTTRAAAA